MPKFTKIINERVNLEAKIGHSSSTMNSDYLKMLLLYSEALMYGNNVIETLFFVYFLYTLQVFIGNKTRRHSNVLRLR